MMSATINRRISLQRDTLQDRTPSWDTRKIDVIEQLSKKFQEPILKLYRYPDFSWKIEYDVELGFDQSALELFEEVVGSPREDSETAPEKAPSLAAEGQPAGEEPAEDPAVRTARVKRALTMPVEVPDPEQPVSRLSRYCSVLWHNEVVPHRLYVRWTVLEDNVENGVRKVLERAPPRAAPPSAPSRPGSIAGASTRNGEVVMLPPPPTAVDDHCSDHGRHWCWRPKPQPLDGEPPLPSKETSLPLANIASVLGWDQVFEREMKTVLWDWEIATQAEPRTPVPWLKKEALQRQRKKEFDGLLKWFAAYFEAQGGQLSKARKEFNTRSKSGVERAQSGLIYEWMQNFEASLLEPPSAHSDGSQGDLQNDYQGVLQGDYQGVLQGDYQGGPQGDYQGGLQGDYQGEYQDGDANQHHDDNGVVSSTLQPFRPVPAPDNVSKVIKGLKNIRDHLLGTKRKKHTDAIVLMFCQAHHFIEERQRIVAGDMIEKRNEQVKTWEENI